MWSLTECAFTTDSVVAEYDFTGSAEGWQFLGAIGTYDAPLTSTSGDALGFSPGGSVNCFSYWYSPDVTITDDTVYCALFTVSSSITNQDMDPQFRLRANQKGSWQGWGRIVTSDRQQAPSVS